MFEESYKCWLLIMGKTMRTTTDPENRLYWVAYLGSYASFSVLVLLEVRENAWILSAFSLLLEKTNYKNSSSLLYRFEHANIVFMLMGSTVPCRTFREISFLNVDLTCARCGNLYTVFNGIFSVTPHLSCL